MPHSSQKGESPVEHSCKKKKKNSNSSPQKKKSKPVYMTQVCCRKI